VKSKKPTVPTVSSSETANKLPFDIVYEDGVDVAVYGDDTDTALAMAFYVSYRGNLSDIDQFIFDLPDDAPIKKDFQHWRAQAVEYFLRPDNHHDMVMFALQNLLTIFAYMRGIRREISLRPYAEHGKRFRENETREGKLGPIAKRIRSYLTASPRASVDEVWKALEKRPGKFYYRENSIGRYIEDYKTGRGIMKWGRFRNLVSEHRPKK